MSYHPTKLGEFIGQKRVVRQVAQMIAAYTRKGGPLPHILLSGPPGTGKTTLARIIAHEMNQRIVLTTPAAIKNNEDLFNCFQQNLDDTKPMKEASPSIIFLDEIHRLPISVEEDLYLPMENMEFVRRGEFETIFDMPPWTLLAATTLPGKLSSPLYERFGLHLMMTKYTLDEMAIIIYQSAIKNKLKCEDAAIAAIALRCRLNPRLANHLLDRCSDVALVAGKPAITEGVADDTFEMLGIDKWGFNDLDRKYLGELYKADRSIGVNSLVPVLDVDKDTIQYTIEPYLLERGMILLTARGRILTPTGRAYVEIHPESIPDKNIGPLEAKGGKE